MTDLVVFQVEGDPTLRSIRLGALEPKGWLKPNLVLAACWNNGWCRLYYLCGSNQHKYDRPCGEYPLKIDRVWQASNPGVLHTWDPEDAARALMDAGVIDRIWLDAQGRITNKGKEYTQ